MNNPTTELQQVDKAQTNQTAVIASQPQKVLPQQQQAVNDIAAYTSLEDAAKQLTQRPTITAPTTAEINKQMWIGSFMTAVMAGLASGNPAGALVGGMWGAIAIHDYGNELQQRSKGVPDLEKAGYSYPAIMAWYEDGDTTALDKERRAMLDDRRLSQQEVNSARNFEEGVRRFNENMDYRNESMAQREQFQQANLSFRRQTLDMRRDQMRIAAAKGQLTERVGNMTPRELAQSVLNLGVDPITGQKATGARMAEARKWMDGNAGYAGTRAGIMTQLGKIDELMSLDMANGTGAVEGRVSPSLFMSGEAQQVRSLIGNLQSGQFLTNIQAMRGMGALSEAEGARIQNVVANLDPTLSGDELRRQITDIQATITGALERLDGEAAFSGWDMPEETAPATSEAPAPAPAGKVENGTFTDSNGLTYTVEDAS